MDRIIGSNLLAGNFGRIYFSHIGRKDKDDLRGTTYEF
jgi:hypothetical protein